MEDQRPNINQQADIILDDSISKLRQFIQAQNYEAYLKELTSVKRLLDESMGPIQRKIFKLIIPELNIVMETAINDFQNTQLKNIKNIIMDFYFKIIQDNDLLDTYQSIMRILQKIFEKDTEEIGFKSTKIFIEYFKNLKAPFFESIYEKMVLILLNFLPSIPSIVSYNIRLTFEERNKKPSFAKNSHKIYHEFILLCYYYLANSNKIVQSQTINDLSKKLILKMADALKEFLNIEFTQIPDMRNYQEQQNAYEDYLSTVTKIVNFFTVLKKTHIKIVEIISIDDIIKVMKIVLGNTTLKETRKEIVNNANILIKEAYEQQFYNEKDFFITESNYLKSGTILTDNQLNEICKYVISFNEDLQGRNIIDEKFKYVEYLISKINNFRLNHDVKNLIISRVNKTIDDLSILICQNDNKNIHAVDYQKNKDKFFDLSNQLLKEFAVFYTSLSKIAHELDHFFIKEDNKSKFDYLEKNIFDPATSIKVDIEKINKLNLFHQIEIILNNEYEKYTLPEDIRGFTEIFNNTNKLVITLVKIINFEFNSQNIVPLNTNTNLNMTRTENINGIIPQQQQELPMDHKIHEKAKNLSKLFVGFFQTYEKFHKQHKHGQLGEDLTMNNEAQLVDSYLLLPHHLCTAVFRKLMPKIYDLLKANIEVCPTKNCNIVILIEKIFDMKSLQENQNQNKNINAALRRELYEIYLDYFSSKMYYAGNNLEEYDKNYAYSANKMSLNITILKNLFRFIIYFSSDTFIKMKTIILINCIILSRNSDFFGNYIYIIRCLFKYIGGNHNQDNEADIAQYALGMLTYLNIIKEDYLFLKDIITEVIIVFPLKFKRLIDYANIIFPSVIESLNMGADMISAGLHSLECWMNILTQKPETVNSLLHKNIKQLTNLLTSHLYKNMNISLNSLKLIAKFGGKSRNYLDDKTVAFKTCPNNILVLNLIDKTTNKLLDFPVDGIIEICMKMMTRKNVNYPLQSSIETFKICMLTFIKKQINYDYIIKVKQDIISNIIPNNEYFNSKSCFKHLPNSEQIKINMIYRKSEHFLFEKILRGIIVCYSLPEHEKEVKELMQFIIEYFVMVMISKDKNNKYMHVFEIDPISIFDMIFEFLFTNSLIVLRNSNQGCTNLAKKFVNTIIDTIYTIFNNNEAIIENLEIIDLMYMKFLNFCYTNEWAKRGVGLIVLNIFIIRLSKKITYKYTKWLLRALFAVTSSYSSNTKIKLTNECNELINELVMRFAKDNECYNMLTVDILNSTMNLDEDIEKAKESFIQMYHFLRYFINEIIENINSESLYEILICHYSIKKIFSKNKKLKNYSPYIFLINHIELNDFFMIYQGYAQAQSVEEYLNINKVVISNNRQLPLPNNNMTIDSNNTNPEIITSSAQINTTINIEDNTIPIAFQSDNKQFSPSNLSIYQSDSIFNNKFIKIIFALMKRLKLNEITFKPMISNSKALIFCYKHSRINVFEFIFKDITTTHSNFDLFFLMLEHLYAALVTDLFFIYEIFLRITKHSVAFNFKNTYMEMVYSLGKKLDIPYVYESANKDYKITVENEIPFDLIDEVARNIEKDTRFPNENTTLIEAYSAEVFPFLYLKQQMLKKYLKILGLFLSDLDLELMIKAKSDQPEIMLSRLYEFKQKTIKIIVSYITRRDEEVLLKMCKKVFNQILSSDNRLKAWISQEENIQKYIQSLLQIIYVNSKCQLKNVDTLLIIHKVIPITPTMIDNIKHLLHINKLSDSNDNFIRSLQNYLSLISLFSYAKYETIQIYGEEIINLFLTKERDINKWKPGYQILNTKYKNKIIKLLTILREEFASYIILGIEDNLNELSSIEFFKKILRDNKAYFIRESFAKKIIGYIEDLLSQDTIEKFTFLRIALKYLVIVSKKAPRYLLINKNLLSKLITFLKAIYQKHQIIITTDIHKIEKYTYGIIQKYTAVFNKDNNCLFDLFHLISLSKSQNEKNQIHLFSMIKLFIYGKKQKNRMILFNFISYFDKAYINNYLEPILKYLILPLMIKFIQEEKEDKGFIVFLLKSYSYLLYKLLLLLENNSIDYQAHYEKWKLNALLLVIFTEKFINKKDKNIDLNNEDIEKIKSNLLQIANINNTLNKKSMSYPSVYWLLNSCLLGKMMENQSNNINFEQMAMFCKSNSDDSLNILNVVYELLYPHNKDPKFFINIIFTLLKDRPYQMQIFSILSLLIKYPNEFQNNTIFLISHLYNYLSKIFSQYFITLPFIQKKLAIQIFGLLIYYNNNEKLKYQEPNEQIIRQENNIWKTGMRCMRIFVNWNSNEYENVELLKRTLTYFREFMSYNMMTGHYQIDISIPKNKSNIHGYLYLNKLYMFFVKKEILYDHFEYFYSLYKIVNDNTLHHKLFNDYGYIMRILLDEQCMNKINERDKVSLDKMNGYKFSIYRLISKHIDALTQNLSKKKMKIGDEDFDNQVIPSDLSFMSLRLFETIKAKGDLTPERIVSLFPQNEFRLWILENKFIYSLIKTGINKQGDMKDTWDKFIKNNDYLTRHLFESWYCYTLFLYEIFNSEINQKLKQMNFSESFEYFKSNHNFYFNLKDIDELKQCRNETIECILTIIIEPQPQPQAHIPSAQIPSLKENDIIIMQETIMIGFNFFCNSQEIMKKYGKHILKLFIKGVSLFKNQMLQPIIEHLFVTILKLPFLPQTEVNKFLFHFLKKQDYLILKININVINVALDYIEQYISNPKNNKQDTYITKSLRILICSSKYLNEGLRKKLFILFEKYHGKKLIDKLKWIFTASEGDISDDYSSWIPFSVDLLLYHFKANHRLETKDPFIAKLAQLCSFEEDIENDNKMNIDDDNEDNDDSLEKNRDKDNNEESDKNKFKQDDKEENNNANAIDSKHKDKTAEIHMEITAFEPEKQEHSQVINPQQNNDNPMDPNNNIKTMITNHNILITSIKSKHLLPPIRDIFLKETTFSQKIWYTLFPQLWKILSNEDREILTVYINEYLNKLSSNQKCYSNMKVIIETFVNCYPMIKISPEIMLSLTKAQNSWTSSYFYLENLLITNIEKERSYNCLIKILDILQEDQLAYGLHQYMTNNEFTKNAVSNLQCSNYFKVENIINNALSHYKDFLDKIELDFNVYGHNSFEEFSTRTDFSIWQSCLITSYKNTNKWNEIISLSKEMNNSDLTTESLWYSGRDNWNEVEKLLSNDTQYPAQINQIYAMMTKKIVSQENNAYQQKCMNCIKHIFQEFITYPQNLENLDYHYFVFFQLIVEAWESTNTLKEMEKNIELKKMSDFRENLITWRDRLPHISEGFQSLKSLLEPRNYLFDYLRMLIDINAAGTALVTNQNRDDFFIQIPNISDKIWNDLMFIKYARKLKLYETYFEYIDLFNNDIKGLENIFPALCYAKNIEEIKFVRQVTYNYSKGIQLVDKYMCDLLLKDQQQIELDKEMKSNYERQKAYFLFKEGNIVDANNSFKKAADLNMTDYHIYNDWAEMSEQVVLLIKGTNKYETIWYENTIINYMMVIIYKLNKSKYIIPRLLSMIKLFPNQQLNNKFNQHIINIPSWVWIFWLPNIFDYYKQSFNSNQSDFFYKILEKVAENHYQSIYYPLMIHLRERTDTAKHYEPLLERIKILDQHDNYLNKIDLMIQEIEAKLERNKDEILLGQLNILIEIQLATNVKEAINKLNTYVSFLKKSNTLGYALITKIVDDLSEVIQSRGVTIFALFDKLKYFRYYLHSKLTTENNYNELRHVLDNKLYNEDFKGVEIPGLYSNKIVEPTKENSICISKFESEYSHKFLNFLNQKLLIKGSNDKLLNFTLSKENITGNSDIKLLQLQTLLNEIFISHKDAYKLKVRFHLPIVYFLKNKIKITQEDPNQYYFNEIFEYSMQKNGYDPEIAYTIYEEEVKLANSPIMTQNYFMLDITEKVYKKMTQIIPATNFKAFIQKFIISTDEILVFRKQFALSYGTNCFLSYLFSELVSLNKISLNKETGSCTFHDFKCRWVDDMNIMEKKREIQMRFSKNISYFLSPASLYGIIPSVIHVATRAIVDKQNIFEKILFCLFTTNGKEPSSIENRNNVVEKFMKKINLLRNVSQEENNDSDDSNPLKVIIEMINKSMNEDNLKKMAIYWDPWF